MTFSRLLELTFKVFDYNTSGSITTAIGARLETLVLC